MTDTTMNCDRLDTVLEHYLEGDLDSRGRVAVERHAGECLRCASLLRSLEQIRSEAARLPELEPSRDLWPGIAARIEAPVIPLSTTGERRVPARFRSTLWLGAAAAGLMAITAGITYTLTMQRIARSGETPVASSDVPSTSPGNAPAERAEAPAAGTPARPAANNSAAAPVPTGMEATTVTYNREITQLKSVLEQRRLDLDPATVAIVENSLRTIDTAIAEARAALVRDPASTFLTDQLNKALEKKLGLLRTVALLPPRA
jgi:hypothetical protein